MRFVRAVAVLCAVFIAGCALDTTPPQTMFPRFSSYVDPAYRAGLAVRTVLIAAPKMSLEARRTAESTMASALQVRGVQTVLGIDVFPPTRGVPTEAEVADELRSRGLDAALVFVPTEERMEVEQGVRRVPTTSTETVFIGGRWREVEVSTTQSIPFTRRLPIGSYVAELKTPTGATAWRAEGYVSSTSSRNSFVDLAATAGTAVVQQLQRDGLVLPPPPPPPPPAASQAPRANLPPPPP